MTEYADKSNEELASAFITTTCELLLIPRPPFIYSEHMHNLLACNFPQPKGYIIPCGSHVEFYIRPLLTCIDDVDYLIAYSHEIVFSGECPVLPSDMSGLADTISCYKMEPYEKYPGFLRLISWGKLNFNWKYKEYEFNYTPDTNGYAWVDMNKPRDDYFFLTLNRMTLNLQKTISGPAINQRGSENVYIIEGTDFVRCAWCPQWPTEAQGWIKRPRSSGWPTIDIVSKVVQNGCHVVCVNHRSCRDDKLQWRFSFSLAEVILLQSWTQIQQIVYHLLRFFAKRELIQQNCPKDDEVLCPYHLKTLMLWTCEDRSSKWWSSSTVISVCSELLQRLLEWLKRRFFPNYFIPEANLFQDQGNSEILEKTVGQLNKFRNAGILCNWFVENYILFFIRSYMKPMEKLSHFVDYMLPMFEFWKMNQLKSVELYFVRGFLFSEWNCRCIVREGCNTGLRQCLMVQCKSRSLNSIDHWSPNKHELKIDRRYRKLPTLSNASFFTYHDHLLYVLHIVYGLGCSEISWDGNLFVEFVTTVSMQPKIVRSQYHNFPKPYTTQNSQFEFLCAQNLMANLTGSNSRSEFQLLSLMSKEFLNKALKNHHSVSIGIVPAALSYLAVIDFGLSDYQEVARLCSVVLIDHTSAKDKETLNAGCLLFTDDIARIVGLCVLQKSITECNLYNINRRLYLDLRVSPEVLAHYLSVLLAERMSKQSNFYHDLINLSFPMDLNLNSLIKHKCISTMKLFSRCNAARQIVYCRPDSLIESDASGVNPSIVKVLDVLMEFAVENVTSFYNVIRKDFGVNCNTADCYRALYLYKCRQYEQVLHLCERILKESDLRNDLKDFSFANVLLLPPLDSFFDRDVQSLLGFHTLFYYLNPLNDEMGKVDVTDKKSFEHFFARRVHRDKGQLFFVLNRPKPNSNNNHYFLGRHFIAGYLKLRCCIDSNLPHSNALTEFAVQKPKHPFEHIIRRFLLRKLCVLKGFC